MANFIFIPSIFSVNNSDSVIASFSLEWGTYSLSEVEKIGPFEGIFQWHIQFVIV